MPLLPLSPGAENISANKLRDIANRHIGMAGLHQHMPMGNRCVMQPKANPHVVMLLLQWGSRTLMREENANGVIRLAAPQMLLPEIAHQLSDCTLMDEIHKWINTNCENSKVFGACNNMSSPSSNLIKTQVPGQNIMMVSLKVRGEPRMLPDSSQSRWLWVSTEMLPHASVTHGVQAHKTMLQCLKANGLKTACKPMHIIMWEEGPYVNTATAGRSYGRLQMPIAPEAKEAQIQSFVQDRVQNRMHAMCEKRLLKLAEISEHACRSRNSDIVEEIDVNLAKILRSACMHVYKLQHALLREAKLLLETDCERDAHIKLGEKPRILETPSVLITGTSEHNGMLAMLLQQLGCAVATCHHQISDLPDVPHYRGDLSAFDITNWDLVIQGWEQQERSSAVTCYAVSRPSYQSPGQMLEQMLLPWQYGASHGRSVLLRYDDSLPPLQPLIRVEAEIQRSRDDSPNMTLGVAIAIAKQWLPVLRKCARHTINVKQIIASTIRGAATKQGAINGDVLRINQLRHRHGKWRVLIHSGAKPQPRRYDWTPLSGADDLCVSEIVLRMSSHAEGEYHGLKPVLEQSMRRAVDKPIVAAMTVKGIEPKATTMLDELRRYWIRTENSSGTKVKAKMKRGGLGFENYQGPEPGKVEPYKMTVRADIQLPSSQRKEVRDKYIHFNKASGSAPALPACRAKVNHVCAAQRRVVIPRAYGADYGVRAEETEGGSHWSQDPPPHPQYMGGGSDGKASYFTSQDIARETELPSSYTPHCTYVDQFVVARRTGRHHQNLHKHYLVPNVVTRVPGSLADTGAAISVVTTGMLKSLPPGTCVSATYQTPQVTEGASGVDGTPLITVGVTTIVFTLSGHAYEEPFLIVEGEPLILLGNDFLAKHRASITVDDGTCLGTGYMWLNHKTSTQPHRRVCVKVRSAQSTISQHIGHVSKGSQRLEGITRMESILKATHAVKLETQSTRATRPAVYQLQYEKGKPGLGTQKADSSSANHGCPETYFSEHTKAMLRPRVHAVQTETAVSHHDPTDAKAEAGVSQLKGATADQLYEQILSTEQHLLYSEDAVTIPPRSQRTLWLRAPKKLQNTQQNLMVDRLPPREGIEQIAPAALSLVQMNSEGKVPVVVWNLHHRPVTIPAFYPTAQLQVDVQPYQEGAIDTQSEDAYERISEDERKLVDSVPIDPEEQLTEKQRSQVKNLLARYVRVFAPNPQKPTHTHAMEVTLPLKPDVKPHRHAASRLGDRGREIIDKHAAEMEANGIIRKSNSPWGSRVVLVPKKTVPGEEPTLRFCVDYRDLNSKLETLDSPLPRCDEAIDRLSSGKGKQDSLFLSVLDLASGFWALPLREQDKPLTAFVTHRQKYEFNYLPFGIQSGPSYMARLMDAVLQGIAWEIAMPYLDDIGIWSTGKGDTLEERIESSFNQMLHRLELVLERLLWAGLSAKAKKCSLLGTRIQYLGHVISREGLHMDPAKLSTISAITPEYINTVERVRSFLGLCSYYRKFISKFSQIAGPLHDLTKDGVDVATESQLEPAQAAVRTLVTALTSEPVVLHTPRHDEIFCVKTDAATTEGIGGVLTQRDVEGKERVIAYYGRRLTPAEKNYTVTEIELLAAVACIKHWRAYLWGRRFKLIVDHAALKWLHSMKDTVEGGSASRLMRWILRLQEYRFDVEHKPGKTHCDADGVSRLAAHVSSGTKPRGKAKHLASNNGVTKAKMNHNANDYAKWLSQARPSAAQIQNYTKKVTTAYVQQSIAATKSTIAVLTSRKVRSKEQEKAAKVTTPETVVDFYMTAGSAPEALRKAQSEDADCIALVKYLLTGDTQEDNSENYRKRLMWARREAKHMIMIQGLLYKRTLQQRDVRDHLVSEQTPHDDSARLYVPSELREVYLTAFHDKLGHHGEKRTYNALRARYYWPRMGQDVQQYVRECHECTMAKRLPQGGHVGLGRPTVGQYPFDDVVCDIVDMTPSILAPHYDKLLVFVDSLSRWVEAEPLVGNPTAREVLNIFASTVVCRHGVPKKLRSDQGSNLVSEMNKIILEEWGTSMSDSGAHHHEALGLAERFNDTLVGMCRAANQGGAHWPEHLPFLLYSYRATPHRVTKFSPSMILYGRELRTPAQLKEKNPSGIVAKNRPDEVKQYVEQLQQYLSIAWSEATTSTIQGQEESARRAQERHSHDTFVKEDRVCLQQQVHLNKLQWKWAGPYRVQKVCGNDMYLLRDLENNIMHAVVHVSNLRRYEVVTDLEPITSDEWLVEALIGHKGNTKHDRKYLVKWIQYTKAESTWEPRSELMRRCEEEVLAYERNHPLTAMLTRKVMRKQTATQGNATASTSIVPKRSLPVEVPSLPRDAKYERGRWWYEQAKATPRGVAWRWVQANVFSKSEQESKAYEDLRLAHHKNVPVTRSRVVAYLSSLTTRNTRPRAKAGPRGL